MLVSSASWSTDVYECTRAHSTTITSGGGTGLEAPVERLRFRREAKAVIHESLEVDARRAGARRERHEPWDLLDVVPERREPERHSRIRHRCLALHLDEPLEVSDDLREGVHAPHPRVCGRRRAVERHAQSIGPRVD